MTFKKLGINVFNNCSRERNSAVTQTLGNGGQQKAMGYLSNNMEESSGFNIALKH